MLAPAALYPTGQSPRSLAAADLNGDGFIDIAASTNDAAHLYVHLNRGCTAYPVGTMGHNMLALASSNATVSANGSASTTLTATLYDPNGHTLANQQVFVLVKGSGNLLGRSVGYTSSAGQVITRLSSTVAETKLVRAYTAGPPIYSSAVSITFQ